MPFQKALSCALALLAIAAAHAQSPQPRAAAPQPPASAPTSGVDRMRAVLDSIQKGDATGLPAATQRAIGSGLESAEKGGSLTMPSTTVDFALRANEQWKQLSRDAYIAALPPRDRALGSSILSGDGTLPGHQGRLFIFVSRSMPMSLLRAYAVDALYTGATLVTKGIRKGDTLKEYIEEALTDFNTAGGQSLAGLEINPNLFDMFDVQVVPAVVWTNRVGLDDIGAGCQNLPEGAPIPQLQLEGPDSRPILVDSPTCAPASPASYYKIAGALRLPYVLDRFEEAGLAKEATQPFRASLAERRGSVVQGSGAALGNAMPLIEDDLKLDRLPRAILLDWKQSLVEQKVQRSPYGPAFSREGDDDPIYRAELEQQIDRGLGR